MSRPPSSPTPIRVLLLEDDPNDAALALETLAAAGLEVTADVAGTRAEFMERVASGSYSLILCDFGLRGWDGLEALRWARASGYHAPFIYVSGTIGEDLAVECMKEGATDYVLKTNLARLPHAMSRALSEEKVRAERDRALKQLRDSEQRFGTAFRASPEGITISSLTDGTYIEAEVIGRTAGELGIWEDAEARTSLLAKLAGSEPVRAHEARFRTRSGKILQVELSAEQIQIQATPCVLAITRDVTELRSLQQQLRQAQKMEAIGRLAGGVAHDFNNLLAVITGYGEIVRKRLSKQDPLHPKVEQILDAAERAAALTRQLLAFSRQQVLQPRILDLNLVVSDLDRMLRPLIGENVELSMVLDPDLGSVRADPGQLAQIVMNLAVNARDAMPGGGRLTIETSNVDFDPAYTSLHPPARPGAHVMLAVSDTGEGMNAETQSHIFEPFFTTKPIGQGTGLGLSTVYGIVKQSDGYVWVYSEVGVGTTFKIYLPRLDAPPAASPDERATPLGRGNETVLLVEDEETLRDLLRETLEGNGYTVLSASDGATALQTADAHAGPIHLIVTDLILPGMNGPRVAETIALTRPEMKVLCMSGYSPEAVARLGVLGRSAGFLGKPFTSEGLLRRVRELLDDNPP
jgi:two-component system cell cycle sensor histidine kinase/response regulator CckA